MLRGMKCDLAQNDQEEPAQYVYMIEHCSLLGSSGPLLQWRIGIFFFYLSLLCSQS